MAQIDNIDPKAEAWLNKPDLELTDLDNNKSIKTNFMYCQRNFLNLRKWVAGLLAYIRYLRKLIDIDSIIAEVFERLRTQKLYFPIQKEWLSEIITHTDQFTGYVYQLHKIDDHTIEITSITDKNFVTDQMCITVKNSEGIIVYPVVKTGGNSITIYFPDEISTNYIAYVI